MYDVRVTLIKYVLHGHQLFEAPQNEKKPFLTIIYSSSFFFLSIYNVWTYGCDLDGIIYCDNVFCWLVLRSSSNHHRHRPNAILSFLPRSVGLHRIIVGIRTIFSSNHRLSVNFVHRQSRHSHRPELLSTSLLCHH